MANLIVSSAVDTLMGSADQAAIRTNVGGLAAVAPGTGVATALAVATNAGGGVIALADPGADRIVFWDDSAGIFTHLTLGTNLSITGTTINASGGGGGGDVSGPGSSTDTGLAFWNGTGGDTLASSTILLTGGNDLAGIGALSATDADFSTLTLGAVQLTATFTELNFVDGVTSAIQTQLNTKAAGAASSTDNAIAVFDGTGGKTLQNSVVIVDPATGDMTGVGDITGDSVAVTTLVVGGVTITASGAELNFTDGVTSAIQTQLNAKANLSGGNTFTGTQVFPSGQALIAPALGTPTSGTLTNCTGLPAASIVAGILAGNLTLGESTGQLVLDPVLSADGTWSGIMEAGTAGATLAFGDLCYFQASDSRWELTDADAEATSGPLMLGMCVLAAAADGSATNILRYGKIRADAKFPALTIGAPVYVGTAVGEVQVAQPSGADDCIRICGHAITADAFLFAPDPTWMVHV